MVYIVHDGVQWKRNGVHDVVTPGCWLRNCVGVLAGVAVRACRLLASASGLAAVCFYEGVVRRY